MKRIGTCIIAVITALCIILSFAACTKAPDEQTTPTEVPSGQNTEAPAEEPTDVPVGDPTEEPAEEPTEEPTEAPTEAPTEVPVVKVDLGEDKGKIFKDDLEGLETLFSEAFDDDSTFLDNAGLNTEGREEVVDGKLCLNILDGEALDNHNAYYPLIDELEDFSASGYQQVQLSFDLKLAYLGENSGTVRDDGVWFASFVGFFLTNPISRIPVDPTDGLFIGLNNRGQFPLIGVTGLGDGGFPTGAAVVKGEKDLFKSEAHVTMVTTNEKKAFLYVNSALVCSVDASGDNVSVYDASGTLVKSIENDPGILDGASFSIWTHCVGAIIDNVTVKAY